MLEAQITRSQSHYGALNTRFTALESAMNSYSFISFNAAKEASKKQRDAAVKEVTDNAKAEKDAKEKEKDHYDNIVKPAEKEREKFPAPPEYDGLIVKPLPFIIGDFEDWLNDFNIVAIAFKTTNTQTVAAKPARDAAMNNTINAAKQENENLRKETDKQAASEYRNNENDGWNDYYSAVTAAETAYLKAHKQTENVFNTSKKVADNAYDTTVIPAWLNYSQQLREYEALFNAAIASAGDPNFDANAYFNGGKQNDYEVIMAKTQGNNSSKDNSSEDDYVSDWRGYYDTVETVLGKDGIWRVYYIDGGIFYVSKPKLIGEICPESGFIKLTNGNWSTMDLINQESDAWQTNFNRFMNGDYAYTERPDLRIDAGDVVGKYNRLAEASGGIEYKSATPDDVTDISNKTTMMKTLVEMLLMEYAMAPGVLASAVKTPQLMGTLSKAKSLKVFDKSGVTFGKSAIGNYDKNHRLSMALVKNEPGFHDVFIHSNGKVFTAFGETYGAEGLAAELTRLGVKGDIRLFACEAGTTMQGTNLAQELATILGVRVKAPTKVVNVKDGVITIYDGGFWKIFNPIK